MFQSVTFLDGVLLFTEVLSLAGLGIKYPCVSITSESLVSEQLSFNFVTCYAISSFW